ncbi:MAG: TonB family protein [Chitinivibrionales bacterium]|nr:TonB family protein [Chitinivibrionales bacterium]
MDRQPNVVVMSAGSMAIDQSLVKQVRGTLWSKIDFRFFIVAIISLLIHGILVYVLDQKEIQAEARVEIEKIPDRFVKLIIEKPLPKEATTAKPAIQETKAAEEAQPDENIPEKSTTPAEKKAARVAAKKQVARRAAQVEKKIRTVGVLGMLTGVGGKGPAVVDALQGTRKERNQDLDKALESMTGLKRASNVDVLDKKLVKSKDVAIAHKEDIGDLVASIGMAKTTELTKKGNFIIQRPESIEGAASSNAKRDNGAINRVVGSHKTSIRMSYEKYLKRNPGLAGKITVRFTIAAAGRIIEVQILENTTGSKDLARDISRKMKMWRFDPISDGDVTVTYPFVFSPA